MDQASSEELLRPSATVYRCTYDDAAERSAHTISGSLCVGAGLAAFGHSDRVSTSEPYELTSTSDGVLFDMDANGVPCRTAWTTAGSRVAFLALDQNGDGTISNGDELIGNHRAPHTPNAFMALQALTRRSNGGIARGSISSDDPLFERLLLWTDVNHDGRSQPSELQHASAVISDIGLGYAAMDHWDANGNEFRYRGWIAVRTASGRNAIANPEDNERRVRNIWEVALASRD